MTAASKRQWVIPMVTCVLICLLASCRSARREEPVVGPLQNSSSKVDQGRIAFMRHCHMCHPQGDGGLGPSLNDKPLPAFGIRIQVRRGFGAMPALHENELPHQDVEAIVAYMKALRKQHAKPRG